MDLNLELARLEQLEQLIDIKLKFLASLDIPKERGTSNPNALGRQFAAIVSVIL